MLLKADEIPKERGKKIAARVYALGARLNITKEFTAPRTRIPVGKARVNGIIPSRSSSLLPEPLARPKELTVPSYRKIRLLVRPIPRPSSPGAPPGNDDRNQGSSRTRYRVSREFALPNSQFAPPLPRVCSNRSLPIPTFLERPEFLCSRSRSFVSALPRYPIERV